MQGASVNSSALRVLVVPLYMAIWLDTAAGSSRLGSLVWPRGACAP